MHIIICEIASGPMITLKQMNQSDNTPNLRKVPKKYNNNSQPQQVKHHSHSHKRVQHRNHNFNHNLNHIPNHNLNLDHNDNFNLKHNHILNHNPNHNHSIINLKIGTKIITHNKIIQ